MGKLMCASMNYADSDCYGSETRKLDALGIDVFHMDICDGVLFPDFSLGLHAFQAVRRNTDKIVDCHLITANPMNLIDLFIDNGADILYVYPEAQPFVTYPLLHIRERGKIPGLAIFSGTPIETVRGYIPFADYVLLNTKNPAYAGRGQEFLDVTWTQVEELCALKEQHPFKLILDGAVFEDEIRHGSAMGVDGFVLGRCLFKEGRDYEKELARLRSCTE